MDPKEKAERLRRLLRRMSEARKVALPGPAPSALEGFAGVGGMDAGLEAADRGLRSVLEGGDLGAAETSALEAIVLPHNRPVLDIRGGTYAAPPHPWEDLGSQQVRDRLSHAIPSVGRVEVPGHPTLPYGGTAFLVADDLVMTNRHVAETFCRGLGRRGLQFIAGRSAGMDFLKEAGSQASLAVDVTKVEMIHPFWDMALLRLRSRPQGLDPLTLSVDEPAVLLQRPVAIIGYPARDWRNDEEEQDRIFRGLYFVKRLQPGYVTGTQDVPSFENSVNALTHDASTLGGNSGSAVVDLTTGRVVGLHFMGEYLVSNYAVPTCGLARDQVVVDAGVRFAGTVEPAKGWKSLWDAVDPPGESPAGPGGAGVTGPPGGSGRAIPHGANVVTVPLLLTISLGEDGGGAGDAPRARTASIEAPSYRIHPDPDYAGRPGYDPSFLGEAAAVPLPSLSEALLRDAVRNRLADPGSHVLPYHHFSIVMSRTRRLAMYTAVNIDGGRLADMNRKQMREEWFYDPRIGRDEQVGPALYEDNPLDRGHLVRRLDPTWGLTPDETRRAHDDTFHWTNCGPQHEGFNRNRSLWAGVENYLLKNAQAQGLRVSVFSGPVFGTHDRPWPSGDGDMVGLPAEYWKVVAMVKTDGRLSATAYLLSQRSLIRRMEGPEAFAFGAYRTFQVPVSEIERATGLGFPGLRAHDPLGAGSGESPAGAGRELESLADLRL